MSRILVVEDEQHIADGLRFNLEAEGHDVTIAADGERALASILEDRHAYDVVVLDVMLPGRDGVAVAADLRAAGQFVPILMLTARGRPEDVLRGFEAGADDYLPKPFELAILLARLRGLLRRRAWFEREGLRQPSAEGQFVFAGKTIDCYMLELRTGDRVVRLTQMEAEFLRYLVSHADKAVSRQ